MLRRLVLLTGALALSVSALAADVGGVKLVDKASVGGQDLVLNGAGIRTRAFFKVYVAGLYVPAKSADPAAILAKGPRRIQLNLLRDLSGEQFVGALIDGLKENNSEAELAAVKAQVDQMTTIMKGFGEVKEGGYVTLDFVDGATQIGLNGSAKGTLAGEAFNKALTKIWIGDKPIQTDLKKALLGG